LSKDAFFREATSDESESDESWYTTDSEGEEEGRPVYEDEDVCEELTLPSGARIGHRLYRRYYKQNIRPESMSVVTRNKNTPTGTRQIYQYVGLTTTGRPAYRAAMDNSAFRKFLAKKNLKLGVSGNKLQTHFRRQTGFF
uniref:SRP_SPB domain-containing protein n=1 Tax=Soboliphyme baturini TaxID=241478 RepID=A0A183J9A9_9BILA